MGKGIDKFQENKLRKNRERRAKIKRRERKEKKKTREEKRENWKDNQE